MIDCEQLKKYIISPILHQLDLYSDSAVNLLLGTAAQESALGLYLHQIKGPALGIYQIEPTTYHDLFETYFVRNMEKYVTTLAGDAQAMVQKRIDMLNVLKTLENKLGYEENLIGNLYYSTAIARIIYYRVPEALPDADNINELAKYYKKYYNTGKGKATISGFVRNYEKYVIGTNDF